MPLTPSTTTSTTTSSLAVDATKATLLELFAELANVSSDAETDATSLLRRNELVALVATRLTSDDALSALESDASVHPSQRIENSSIVSSVIQAISPRTPTPLRLIALEQLAIFFSVSISASRRERASNALLRCGIARALVDDCLCDADHIDVSQAATRLLLRWGGDPSDAVARAFFDDSDADSVASCIVAQRAKPCSDIVSMRIYELVVLLYTRSDFAARRCDSHSATASLLAAMASTLTSDDILLKLNVVELVSQLCMSREGVQYCERSGTLRLFVDAIGEPEDPFARMYSTLVIKCIGRFVPLDTYDGVQGELGRHAVIQRLSSLFARATDPDLLTEACTALASLMANIDSAYAMLLTNTVHHYILPLIVAHNRVLGTAALYAFGTLVRRLEEEELSENFVNMCTIDNDPFLLVLQTRVLRNNENSKTPLRMAAFSCLQAIASKTWGTAALANDATWFEFLVSRDSELNMAGWHAKYELVRTVEERLVQASIGEPKSSTIAKYLRDGAIFTRAEPRPEVAMKS